MKSFKIFLENEKLTFEMFGFSKKIDKVFIDKNDGNTIKTLDKSGNPSDTIKTIKDYINQSNPIASLKKDLNERNLTFKNFSNKDLEQIVLFFLTKNLPKDIELNLGSSFMGITVTDTSGRISFLENLIDKLEFYFVSSERINQIVDFIIRHFNEALKSKHLIEIIKSSPNETMPILINKLSAGKLFGQIEMDDFINLIKEKYLENIPIEYLKELIKFYVSESGLSLSVKDLEKIKIFVIAFNKEHEKNPIDIIDLINLKAERKKTKDFWDGAFRPDDYN